MTALKPHHLFLVASTALWSLASVRAQADEPTPPAEPAPRCDRQNPTLSFEDAHATTREMMTAFYTLRITNNDSADCPAAIYNLTSNPSHPGLRSQLKHAAVIVEPGASVSTDLTVTPTQVLIFGDYYISVMAKAIEAGNYIGTATATLSYQGDECLYGPISLNAEPMQRTVSAGGQVSFMLTTRNTNRGSCGDAYISFFVEAPEGFASALQPSSLQLRGGDSVSSVFLVNVGPRVEPGDYKLTVKTNAPHDIYQGVVEVVVRVVAPGTEG